MDFPARILGLDYGEKRVGVAVSDPLRITAQPVKTIQYKSENILWREVDQLFHEFQIELVVLGLPLHMNGSEGISALKVKKFAQKINDLYKVKVKYWDERLTSLAAEKTIQKMGKQPSHYKEKIDMLSAVMILQGFMDRQRNRSLTF